MRAAALAGFNITQRQHCVCVSGTNQPGLAAALTEDLAEAKINLRSFSAAVIGTQFVAYIAADSQAETDKAIAMLKTICNGKHGFHALSILKKGN